MHELTLPRNVFVEPNACRRVIQMTAAPECG
jgi:hypothetical protein